MFETTVVESKKQKVGLQKYMTLPVSIGLHIVVIAAVLVCFVATIYPSRQAARLDPAQALRYE